MTVLETLETAPETTIPIEVQILERAALIIEEHGHCYGALFQDPDGHSDDYVYVDEPRHRYCAVGAIWRAAWERGLLPRVWSELWAMVPVDADGEKEGTVYDVIGEVVGFDSEKMESIYRTNDTGKSASFMAASLRSLALGKLDGDGLA